MGDALRLTGQAGISFGGDAVIAGAPWLVVRRYEPDRRYQTTYVTFEGATPRFEVEPHGVLPELFEGPDGEAWAVLTDPYGDRDVERVKKVGGPPGEGFVPFVHHDAWLDGDALVMALGTKRLDQWLRYELRTGKRKFIRLGEPGLQHFVRNDEGLHGLSKTRHCLLSAKGEVLKARAVEPGGMRVPVELCFEGPSSLFEVTGFDTLWWLELGRDGKVERTKLATDSFFSLYPPLHLDDGSVVLRYVGERGNGWFVVKGGQVRRHVSSTKTGYVDERGAPVVTLPEGQWVLAGLLSLGNALFMTAYAMGSNEALWVCRVSQSS